VAGSCGHGNEALGSIKGGKFFDLFTITFSRRTLLHGVSYSISYSFEYETQFYTAMSEVFIRMFDCEDRFTYRYRYLYCSPSVSVVISNPFL
jgi:hypothetical protein